ncbi:MAG: hypothetical protein PWR25_1216 [Euryarchaeota archaeon]|nr:hypothetical protein [Euryarchaeota archaeon]MDN5339793.1 hypothetical protein [Euryarchaeota archaeon]
MSGSFVRRLFGRWAQQTAPSSDRERACGTSERVEPQSLLLPERTRDRYRAVLHSFLLFRDDCARIPIKPRSPATEIAGPGWCSPGLPALDALSLYCMLCLKNPKNYIELGSGPATRFARRAIRDRCLRTTITVYDRLPYPGDPANLLADRRRRAPIPVACDAIVAALEPGDILHVEISVVQGQGLSAIRDEILPNLRPGVLVHLSECLPLGDGDRTPEILLSCADVSRDPELPGILAPLWSAIGLGGDERCGKSCWIRAV